VRQWNIGDVFEDVGKERSMVGEKSLKLKAERPKLF